MKKLSALALLLISLQAGAQDYCAPTFANGCSNWRTLEVQAGTLLWTPGADDCWIGIYTGMSTDVDAGSVLPLRVTNGVWCGVAVWVDLDQSGSFEAAENLYYSYVGGAPSYQYEFGITIPSGTPTGSYRMRIISPWGSDGVTTENGNGNGPCGFYQYGDFKDFTLNVGGTTAVAEARTSDAVVSPNPAHDVFAVSGLQAGDQVDVLDLGGRSVHAGTAQSDRLTIDASAWRAGLYAVRISGPRGTRSHRIVVE